MLEQVAAPLGVVLHPRAIVSATAQLGPGSVVPAGAVVDHDAICGAYSQLGVNAAKPVSLRWHWHLVRPIPEKAWP